MERPRTLPAFTPAERIEAHRLLATRVAFMMGRKFEEGDWTYVYCAAKDIPSRGWSNLNIDIMHRGLGVEHKMLRPSVARLLDACGTRLMHPAATRSIRVPSTDIDPSELMAQVLNQYAQLIEQRRRKVREDSPGAEPDLRTGWLLWHTELREFLYFEEEMIPPDPNDYFAEWKEVPGGGRKGSKNLWVYEKDTGHKRFSITTTAGAKIQPYFDVPPPNDPNLCFFRVQGEVLDNGLIRVWIAASTERELRRIVGEISAANLARVISEAAATHGQGVQVHAFQTERALPILLTPESYALLEQSFPGVSDEHRVQLLVLHLSGGA
ncbi:MAG: hypothetical protein HY331_09395 [Chloroflexi bacterium]|nr:hypothetical protein [Chloroflexota bacterium]